MKSITRKLKAWRRRLEKEQPLVWVERYKLYSARAFARLEPVPADPGKAKARVDRLDRHLRRLHAVAPPFTSNRLDLVIHGTLSYLTVRPRLAW